MRGAGAQGEPDGMSSRPRTVRPPATRDQADAYRFGLRRLESALVRADPVPSHEYLRSQRRATLAGVLLGVLGLAAVAVWALLNPHPDWRAAAVVLGRESGSLYVVAEGERLVPVANMAAARLVLAALRDGGAATADGGATPTVVPDADLTGVRRTATAAVAGAVAVHPDGPPIDPRWAICDRAETRPDDAAELVGTTVLAGAQPGPLLDGAVYVIDVDRSTWLVLRGRRHAVSPDDGLVGVVLGLRGRVPRPISAGLLTAIPQGPPLLVPEVSGAGELVPGGLPVQVGDVVVSRLIGGADRHHVVLGDGVQEVPATLAAVLGPAVRVEASALARMPARDQLITAPWPDAAPTLLAAAQAPVLCWSWTADGPGPQDGPAAESVTVGGYAEPPSPPGSSRVELASADGPGEALDEVLLTPGGGGAVRSTGPGGPAGFGTRWLLSATGVAHGVADDATAAALGVASAPPAPELALRLLPRGPTLDLADAREVMDQPGAG